MSTTPPLTSASASASSGTAPRPPSSSSASTAAMAVAVEESVTVRALEEASALLHDAMRLVKELGPVAPVPLHETSLTLAALDLALTFRVHTMLPGYTPGSRHTEVDFNCLKSAVKHLKKLGGPANHHPHGGYGGADSILLYLTHALATTVKCLRGLRRASRAKEQWRTRLRALAFVGLAFLWKRRLRTMPLLQGRRVLLWLVGLSYLGRKLRYYALKRSVDDCHKRLLTILRLWVIMDCVMVYTENWKDGGVEYRTLIARLNQEDVRSKRWLSRQLLEAVPPPPETAFWYEASPVAAFLRRFMSVVYASFGVGVAACEAVAGTGSALALAHPTTPSPTTSITSTSPKPLLHKHPHLGWPLVGVPTTGLAFLYYSLRPGAASRDACKRMSPAPIAMLQRAWTSLDNPITRWVAMHLIARRQGLVYQRWVTVAGVPCTVMARSDPRAFTSPRALFFVHGGGFVAHLFLADMAVLTAWTLGLGHEGVLLIPEYTLVPEGRYPKPITELLGVYRAVLQGGEPLGFVPASLAVAGESAGGNLAAALMVAVGSALQLYEHQHHHHHAHAHANAHAHSKKAPYPSPPHHPGLASMATLPTILYTGQSCQSLASYAAEEEGEEGAGEALLRASVLAAAAVAEEAAEQEQEQQERAVSPVLGEAADVEAAAVAPSTPSKEQEGHGQDEQHGEQQPGQAGGEGTGSGTSSEASSPFSPPASASAFDSEPEHETEGHEEEEEKEEACGGATSLRMPDALVLFYPVLNFCLSPSPSRSVHMADPILPLGMFTTVADAYLPAHDTDPTRDPLISPYFVHDALLQRFWPPTFIGVGGFDPLLDDTVDFDVRLRHLGVPSTLRLGRDLPHGFFGLYDLDPSATKIMDEAGGFLHAHLLPPTPTNNSSSSSSSSGNSNHGGFLAPVEREESSGDPCVGLEGSRDGGMNLLVAAGAVAAYHRGPHGVEAAAGGASPMPPAVLSS